MAKRRKSREPKPVTGFDEFKECLLLLAGEDYEEIYESMPGGSLEEISQWTAAILEDWEAVAKPMIAKDHNALLWRIAAEPFWIGQWLEANSLLELDLDLDHQTALVQAAKHVTLAIPQLFAPGEPMENGYFMWWDLLLDHQTLRPELADTCLEILRDLSWRPDERVQAAALHGLGHLMHPGRPAVVDEFIRRHPEARGDRWILECREGTVM